VRRTGIGFVFAGLLLWVGVSAHEGHAHKIMGTVSAVQENRLEVKDTGGKISTVMLADKTAIVRGSTALKRGDLRAGDRVVVTATQVKGSDGKTTIIASRIQVGTAKPPAAQ
jgi:hypothetical protein